MGHFTTHLRITRCYCDVCCSCYGNSWALYDLQYYLYYGIHMCRLCKSLNITLNCFLACSPVSELGVQESPVPVTVPTFVREDMPPRESSRSYYFVCVEATDDMQQGINRSGSVSSSEPSIGCSWGLSNRSLVCERLEGLEMGAPIAAGSYGRVYRARYHGEVVSGALRRDMRLQHRRSEGSFSNSVTRSKRSVAQVCV